MPTLCYAPGACSLAPHIVLGLRDRRVQEEYEALAMLERAPLASLVIVVRMPLPQTRRWDPGVIDVDAAREFFLAARGRFPKIPVILGCAKPMGRVQVELDNAAVESGFDGVAYPAEEAVRRARELGREIRFSEYCCALMS